MHVNYVYIAHLCIIHIVAHAANGGATFETLRSWYITVVGGGHNNQADYGENTKLRLF